MSKAEHPERSASVIRADGVYLAHEVTPKNIGSLLQRNIPYVLTGVTEHDGIMEPWFGYAQNHAELFAAGPGRNCPDIQCFELQGQFYTDREGKRADGFVFDSEFTDDAMETAAILAVCNAVQKTFYREGHQVRILVLRKNEHISYIFNPHGKTIEKNIR